MRNKVIKRVLAIALCVVIVLSGREYMLADSLHSEETEEEAGTETSEEVVLPGAEEEENTAEEPSENPSENPEETQEEEQEGQKESGETEPDSDEKAEEDQDTEKSEEESLTEKLPAEELPEEEPVLELSYEDSRITVKVKAEEAGVIPAGAVLSVTPIEKKEVSGLSGQEKEDAEKINALYDATAEKLQEKAEGEDYGLLGFLAYDICFLDEEGTKLEPEGSVSVTMDYKEAAIPEEVKQAEVEGADVTLMHLKEDTDGQVREVVDMVADEKEQAQVQTNANTEVEKAEFVTDSFSVFSLMWMGDWNNVLNAQLVDSDGRPVGDSSSFYMSDLFPAGEVSEVSVENIEAPQVSGYQFTGTVVMTTEKGGIYDLKSVEPIHRLRRIERKPYQWSSYTISVWQFNRNDTGDDWADINGTVCFVYSKGLIDLNGKAVSAEEYEKLASHTDYGTLPITWSRSTGTLSRRHSDGLSWTWEELMEKLGDDTLTIRNDSEIWDGSRSGDGGLTSRHQYNYLTNDKITAYGIGEDRKLYDSASWAITNGENTENFYRFRGIFDLAQLGQGESYTDYDYTIQSVVNAIDPHIYINDNLFVFVYPTDVTLDNSNYLKYLAFWTGTSNQSSRIKSFNGRPGTRAYNNLKPEYGAEEHSASYVEELAYITDGWYTNPVEDGAGGIIQDSLRTDPGHTKFYVDVITHDNAQGGAMYRLQVSAKPVEKTTLEFYKTDSSDLTQMIANANFELTADSTGSTYPLTTGTDGRASVRVPKKAETYTLRESEAVEGYETTENTWKVTVEADGSFRIQDLATADENSSLGQYQDGEHAGAYYITNVRKPGEKLLKIRKVWADQENRYEKRPAEITAVVTDTADGTEVAVVKLDKRNSWEASVTVPEDMVCEVTEKEIPEEYTAEIRKEETESETVFTITNTLGTQKEWQLVKISENAAEDGSTIYLEGAVFELYDREEKLTATLTTDEQGKAEVLYEDPEQENLEDGTYTLKEIQAPGGYALSKETWELTFAGGIPVGCSDGSLAKLTTEKDEQSGTVWTTLTIKNQKLQELPGTGGKGTRMYTIGGCVLLLAAAGLFLLERRKKKQK